MYSLLAANLIIPYVMISVGDTFKKHPASDMDSNNGYNTPVSRKTREHWDYAQSIAPDIFISFGKALGLIETVLGAVMYFTHVSIHTALGIGGIVGVGFLFLGFYKTDSEIEKKFTEI